MADSCEQMLSDPEAVKRMAELRKVDKGVFNKVKRFIRDFAQKIRDLYKSMKPDSAEARYVSTMLESFDQLQEVWLEGVTGAAENYGKAEVVENNEKTFTAAEALYSNRKNLYTYDYFISKPDMPIVDVDASISYTRDSATKEGKKNSLQEGYVNQHGSISVIVNDTGKTVVIGNKGLRHGLRRANGGNFAENLLVTSKAGSIIKNSIQINELNPKYSNQEASYPLLGIAKDNAGNFYVVETLVDVYTNEAVSMDVLYSMNAKKEPVVLNAPSVTTSSLRFSGSTINVSDFLDLVNKYFPDILPEDVLKHYGYTERPAGEFGKYALYSDRDSTSEVRRQWEEAKAMEASHRYDFQQQRKEIIAEYEKKLKEVRRQWNEEAEAIIKSKDYDRREDLKQQRNELQKQFEEDLEKKNM